MTREEFVESLYYEMYGMVCEASRAGDNDGGRLGMRMTNWGRRIRMLLGQAYDKLEPPVGGNGKPASVLTKGPGK